MGSQFVSNNLTIQYIGQVGVILRKNDVAVAIDPYLTDSVDQLSGFPENFWQRRYAPPVKPESLTDLDLVLCTHEHMDHLDPDTLRAIAFSSPKCQFGAPKSCLPQLAAIGISKERLHALGTQEQFEYNANLTIQSIPACGSSEVRHGCTCSFRYVCKQ